MINENDIKVIGRLAADPKIKSTGGANPKRVMELVVATNEDYLDQNTGKVIKNVQWHKVMYWNENHSKVLIDKLKLSKGNTVYVTGSMVYSSFEINKVDGIQLPVTITIPTAKIRANNVQLFTANKDQKKSIPEVPATHWYNPSTEDNEERTF